MELAIEELAWQFEGSDRTIEQRWTDVERAQRWVASYQEQLTEALSHYNDAIARKESLRQALVVLRNAETQ